MPSKLETLRQVAAGELTLDEAAARHGVAPATIFEWSELFLAGAKARRRSPLAALLIIFGAFGLVGAARAACNAPVFGNLIGVCADTPAVAGDYNANLQKIDARLDAGVVANTQVRNDVSAKVGALGVAGVTLQAPVRIGGCTGGEVPVFPSDGGALECLDLYGSVGALFTSTESTDLSAFNDTNTAQLGPTADRVCFLSNVDVPGSNSGFGGGHSECSVDVSGSAWVLTVNSTVIGGGTACRARCLVFNR